jgi:sugar phosphate isomerase/epimerase
MQIKFFCTRWGNEQVSWDLFCERVKASGYDGIECSPPFDSQQFDEMQRALEKYGLHYIAQHWETNDVDFARHCSYYELRLRYAASANPLFINSQSGKDYYTFEQNKQLLHIAESIALETSIPIIHETHRGRFSYAAHVTSPYIKKLPLLKLAFDVSHWCTVAASYLHDQQESLHLAIENTVHIHARVGHTESPQVPDPADTLWTEALDFHIGCWDKIIAHHQQRKTSFITITPEFGPPPYLILLPHTHKPISDQWNCNIYMMEMLKKRYTNLE